MKKEKIYQRLLFTNFVFIFLFFLAWVNVQNALLIQVVSAIGCGLSVFMSALLMILLSQFEEVYYVTSDSVGFWVMLINPEDPKDVVFAFKEEFRPYSFITKTKVKLVNLSEGITAFHVDNTKEEIADKVKAKGLGFV